MIKTRVLICGDRHYNNRKLIREYLETLPKDTVVIEGEADGADTIAREESVKLGLTVVPFPAFWDRYGKAAGPIRNTVMLVKGKPDLVVPFHNHYEKSIGTFDMVQKAKHAKVKVVMTYCKRSKGIPW